MHAIIPKYNAYMYTDILMKNGDFQTRMIRAVFVKAVLLLAFTVEQSLSNRYYVTPDITTTPCPENPCYQSKTFFLNISSVVATNATIIFLPGNHYLESEDLLLIQNQVNLLMMASADNYFAQYTIAKKVQEYGYESFSDDESISYMEPSAKIICTNRSGFAFVNISNLIIANLTFVNCGQFYSATGLNASVHLKLVYNLAMEGVSIQNGTGYGLLAVDVLGRSAIADSSFIGNNQFYKSLLESENTSNCKDEVWITYQRSRSSQPEQSGGNVLFRYNAGTSNVSPLGHSLLVSNVLIALGIDASETSSGAGLRIDMENMVGIDVSITNVRSYRNQANNGANTYFNRSSVFCGWCSGGLSMTFGTYQCKQCSDYYLLLIIPFAVMGVLLVIGLVMLDITVSTGVLNGIILYVNIIRINNSLFFQNDDVYSRLLSVLIAWMNLDLGIETCFYDGMNSIAKTWLQFVFPTYIFALVGIIVLTIILGRYSSTISRLCQVNTFPALATLILLSYSKILRTIITIISYVKFDTTNGTLSVWQYDVNIEYFGAEHLPLFIFGLVVSIIFVVPFPILLMAAPLLQSRSHIKYFFWVNKFKVFFDSYQAPHKDRYRFWPGFFLFIRLPLFMVFTLSESYDVKLFSIVVFSLLYSCLVGALSIYKNWHGLSLFLKCFLLRI